MADHAVDDFDGDIFIYRGGRAPQHVTHVLIDESVDDVEVDAFRDCEHLVQVDTHDGLRTVGKRAFYNCKSLRRINLKSAVDIGYASLYGCENLESVEFGDKLERIGNCALCRCSSLQRLKLPSIADINMGAFTDCTRLTDIELSKRLQTIGARTFWSCSCLRRIAMPMKRDLISDQFWGQEYNQFGFCEQLTTVDLVGGIHTTVSSLHMESWRTEMIAEINRINQHLPTTPANEKTDEIRQWMHTVVDKLDHYKSEHCRYVKEGITLLELALWKAKLREKEEKTGEKAKKAKVDVSSARKEKHITCGAGVVIKNVLPFLELQ